MPARIHLFMNEGQRALADELVVASTIPPSVDATRSVLLTAAEYAVSRSEAAIDPSLSQAKIPDTIESMPLLLREGLVKSLFGLASRAGIEKHDFAMSHMVNCGLRWLHEDWKSGSLIDLPDRVKNVAHVRRGRYS